MKKLIFFIFFIINSINLFAQDSVMVELRKLFYMATLSESYMSKVDKYMDESEEKIPFESYRAMLLFMEAKYAFNPYTKLNYFKKGRKKMEQAIKLYPEDIETRFLRLAIQTKLPSFLGYSGNKQKDKEFLKNHCKHITDKDLRGRLKLFFKENKILTEEELKEL